MVLLGIGMLLRTDSGLETLAILHASMITCLMRSTIMARGRPCLAIKSATLYDAVSPDALLPLLRNPFNFDDEEQLLSLRASKYSFCMLAN